MGYRGIFLYKRGSFTLSSYSSKLCENWKWTPVSLLAAAGVSNHIFTGFYRLGDIIRGFLVWTEWILSSRLGMLDDSRLTNVSSVLQWWLQRFRFYREIKMSRITELCCTVILCTCIDCVAEFSMHLTLSITRVSQMVATQRNKDKWCRYLISDSRSTWHCVTVTVDEFH